MPTAEPSTTEILRWILDESRLDNNDEAVYAITLMRRCLLSLLQKLPDSEVGAKFLAQNEQLVHVAMTWKLQSHPSQDVPTSTSASKGTKRKRRRSVDQRYTERAPRSRKAKATKTSANTEKSAQGITKSALRSQTSLVPSTLAIKPNWSTKANNSIQRSRSEPVAYAGSASCDTDGRIATRRSSLGPLVEFQTATHSQGVGVLAQRHLDEIDAWKGLHNLSITTPTTQLGNTSYDKQLNISTTPMYNPSDPENAEADEAEGDDERMAGDPELGRELVDALNEDLSLNADQREWNASRRTMIVQQLCDDLVTWAGHTNLHLESICEPDLIVAKDDDSLTANVRTYQLSDIADRIDRMEGMQHTMECFVRLNWVGLDKWVEFRKIHLGTEGIRNGVLTRIRDELINYTLTAEPIPSETRLQSVKKVWQRRLRASRRWGQLYGYFGAGILLIPRMAFDCRNFGDVSNADFENAFAEWKVNEELEELVRQLEPYAARLFSGPTGDWNKGLIEGLRGMYASETMDTVEVNNISAVGSSEISPSHSNRQEDLSNA